MSEWGLPTSEAVEIESIDLLTEAFHQVAKPPERFLIGLEVESFGVSSTTGSPITYSGPSGVSAILTALSDQYGWQSITEHGQPIALIRDHHRVTLEPGGQIELSSAPAVDMFELAEDFARFRDELVTVSRPLGVTHLGMGTHPFAPVDRIGWVPKSRYDRMKRYLPSRGHLAHHMMKATASIQVSLDFSDEEDMRRKFRVGMALAPLAVALFASSPLSGGQPNGYHSLRGHIWRYTDPDRCGLIPDVLDNPDFGYSDYVRYALDVPIMLLYRDGAYLEVQDLTFRRFIEEGLGGRRALWTDWSLHLSSIFTEVRLKNVLEFRSADSQHPALTLAVPAFWKGLLYDPATLDAVYERTADWSFPEMASLFEQAARNSLGAEFRGRKLIEWAGEFVDLATNGLESSEVEGPDGRREAEFLEPLRQTIEQGGPAATEILAAWEEDSQQIDRWILDRFSYSE